MIQVCCAIIQNEGKMLAVQRGPRSSHPWKWEFPGGKVHPFEIPEQCIVREIQEELMIGVQILHRLQAIDFDYGTKPLCLIPFVCHRVAGQIHLTEHVAMRWISVEEWENLDWAEADKELIIKNMQQITLLIS